MKLEKIKGFGTFGGIVTDFNLSAASDDEIRALGRHNLSNLLTIVPKECASISAETLHYVCSFWGTHMVRGTVEKLLKKPNKTNLEKKVLEEIDRFKVDGLYGIIRVSGKKDQNGNSTGMFADGELEWHSNGSGMDENEREPCIGLVAAEGSEGSVTEFLQTADAYASLNSEWKKTIDNLKAIHRWQSEKTTPGLNEVQAEVARLNLTPFDNIALPLKATSPGGIEGIHFPFNSIIGFEGYTENESKEIFSFLMSHFVKEEYIYSHKWRDGDVIWMDQTITLHRRPTKDCSKRVMYRVCTSYDFLTGRKLRPSYELLKNQKLAQKSAY